MTSANSTLPENATVTSNGSVFIASENRFNSAHYSEALTAFTVGWKDNEPLMELLDFIAPPVNVGRRFEFKRADHSECFLSEIDDVRAPGATFKRVEYSGSSVYEKTLNKGLTMRIDHDDIVSDSCLERYTQLLLQRLCRSEVRRALMALLSLSPEKAQFNWKDGSQNGPDSDVLSAIIALGNESNVEPTRALYGRGAWQLRHQFYANQDKSGAFAGLLMTPGELANSLGLDAIRVAKERIEGEEGKNLSNYVVLFNAQSVIDKDDPSNLKRFVTPTEQGLFRVFVENHAKYVDLSVEHYSNIVTTSTLGAQVVEIL